MPADNAKLLNISGYTIERKIGEGLKTLALGEEKKTCSFRLLGGLAVLTLSVLVGIGVWSTRSTDMPASLPGTVKSGTPVEQATNSARSLPANVHKDCAGARTRCTNDERVGTVGHRIEHVGTAGHRIEHAKFRAANRGSTRA